ncbi:Zinc finger, CCCH-type [Corchorus capsularis]|uniref:Zinc finger, CCCH-type n=1 Tax=Corchorus capsularis TaxID=210143 RepID=A0A1R3IN24_COCAP|nr:Zinc finger, CCCH-type [Corchorus capsularis]
MCFHGGKRRVFNRLGGDSTAPTDSSKNQKVCYHWRAGKCNRYPCRFLHGELPDPSTAAAATANGSGSLKRFSDDSGFSGPVAKRGPNYKNKNTWVRSKTDQKVCTDWMQGQCTHGDGCKFLHSWSLGEGFALLNHLDGHQEFMTGICWPGSDTVYSGSRDGAVRAWNSSSGECVGVANVGGEVGCMFSEGPWVFVGIPDAVKAWNTQTNSDLSLSGPVGQVYALATSDDLLLAGSQDGTILAWKFNAFITNNNFEAVPSLKGHTRAVVSLVVSLAAGAQNRVYSGSVDHSIKVWSLDTLQCLQTLTEHTDVVMSLLCWEQFLLSCSLDQTIKVWIGTNDGGVEVTHTRSEEHGLLVLRGMHDMESKPVLLCVCNDNSVRLYDLPSFSERGKIFAKQDIRAIAVGPDRSGLFFTGDGTGFKVCKWAEAEAEAEAEAIATSS